MHLHNDDITGDAEKNWNGHATTSRCYAYGSFWTKKVHLGVVHTLFCAQIPFMIAYEAPSSRSRCRERALHPAEVWRRCGPLARLVLVLSISRWFHPLLLHASTTTSSSVPSHSSCVETSSGSFHSCQFAHSTLTLLPDYVNFSSILFNTLQQHIPLILPHLFPCGLDRIYFFATISPDTLLARDRWMSA